jgi:serine/threonine protein kinase
MALAAGDRLGPYEVVSLLGSGGMGDVFRAVDTRLGRAVAVKTSHERFTARFEREARLISSLNHPNICTLYDVGPNYLVMELVDGETVAARLKTGALPARTALLYASQILAALAEAHEKGIIHRDLKPGNIMIAKSGVKVLDFGLATTGQDETVTVSRMMIMGTPAYMAPEQRQGQATDARTDIYSFGLVLYEMMTGVRGTVPRRRFSSRKLEAVVSRCLEEDPARRWQSVAEVEREIASLLGVGTRGKLTVSSVTVAGPRSPSARRTTRPPAKSTIVLADFTNTTGDSTFDGALRQILALRLENAPRLLLLPEARVSRTLALMGHPARATLTHDVATQVCERTASAAVVEGSITSLGSEYLVSLRARDCRTGDIVEQLHAPVARKDDVFKVLSKAAKRFANRAGESISPPEKEPSLPDEVTTSSQAAWKSYSAAMKAFQSRSNSNAETILLLKRAVEVDPDFAMGYATLGRTYSDLGESELGAQYTTKAYELRDRVSDQENLYIAFNYHRQVTRNLELARQTLESWAQKYPNDLHPRGFLSGFVSPGSGHYEKAVKEGLKAIDLDPNFSIGYENVSWVYLYLNRPLDAEEMLRKAADRKIDAVRLSLIRYAIAFLRGDNQAMERVVTERRKTFQGQGVFEHQEALTHASRGQVKEAARLADRAVALARQAALQDRAAQFEGARAVWSALFEMRAEAQKSAAAALSLSRSRDADYGPAFALALLQDSTNAHEIAVSLEARYPQDTSVQFSYLPALRALEALNEGDPAKALEMTQAATPYDLAIPGVAFFTGAFFGALYPVYVRGLAYSRLGRPNEAAGEFRKILDRPGLVLNDPIGPMARLQLARALSACRDRAGAASAYHDLLNLWQNADPDTPVVQRALAECAKVGEIASV